MQSVTPGKGASSSSPIRYYDISPEISEQLGVWPGDTPFSQSPLVDFDGGSQYLLQTVRTTLHLGAHTDAPNHYHHGGSAISERSLHYYLGPCQVISVPKKAATRISPKELPPIRAERVLFHTESFPDPNQWNEDFMALSSELVDFLAKQGVILIGIDTPSIDLFDAKVLESHQAVHRHDMAILEGVVLTAVPDGVYSLVALPLRIKRADASPVRAVLIPQGEKTP